MPRCYLLQFNEDPWALLGADRPIAAFTLREKLLEQLDRMPDGEVLTVSLKTETVSDDELLARDDW